MELDKKVFGVVLIKAGNEFSTSHLDKEPSGTGFLYCTYNNTYLVTARHVLVDNERGHRPYKIEFDMHTDVRDLHQYVPIEIGLYDDEGEARYLTYPGTDKIDLTIIDVTKELAKPREIFYRGWTRDDFLPRGNFLQAGEDLLAIGYPEGFYDSKHGLPIFKKAALSSSYGVPFDGYPIFITDFKSNRGMSGSPIITATTSSRLLENDIQFGRFPMYLLGVNTGPYKENIDLQLNATVDVRIIDDMINQDPISKNNHWYFGDRILIK